MEHLISQYIDDELSLDDKIEFVRAVHKDPALMEDAVTFLAQEKLLRRTLAAKAGALAAPEDAGRRRPARNFFGPLGWAGWAVAILLVVVFTGTDFRKPAPDPAPSAAVAATRPFRFVIFKPGISSAEISGSFTGWRKVPLQPTTTDGYWEVTLQLEAGEHRFVYILDNSIYFPDPTVPARETDDFGATNSILRVEV